MPSVAARSCGAPCPVPICLSKWLHCVSLPSYCWASSLPLRPAMGRTRPAVENAVGSHTRRQAMVSCARRQGITRVRLGKSARMDTPLMENTLDTAPPHSMAEAIPPVISPACRRVRRQRRRSLLFHQHCLLLHPRRLLIRICHPRPRFTM